MILKSDGVSYKIRSMYVNLFHISSLCVGGNLANGQCKARRAGTLEGGRQALTRQTGQLGGRKKANRQAGWQEDVQQLDERAGCY
jgi:hypothetical protein